MAAAIASVVRRQTGLVVSTAKQKFCCFPAHRAAVSHSSGRICRRLTMDALLTVTGVREDAVGSPFLVTRLLPHNEG